MKIREIAVELKVPFLLMHNEQLADPLNDYTKKLKEITGKRKKTDEDHEEMSRREFQGGLYFDEAAGPFIPAKWLSAMLIEGARRTKNGKEVEAFVRIAEAVDGEIPLQYEGPRTRKGLGSDKSFTDRRCVGNQQNRVMRTRPCFRDCSFKFTIQIFEGGPNTEIIEEALNVAGLAIGIGDGRPRLAGQFTVEKFEEIKK